MERGGKEVVDCGEDLKGLRHSLVSVRYNSSTVYLLVALLDLFADTARFDPNDIYRRTCLSRLVPHRITNHSPISLRLVFFVFHSNPMHGDCDEAKTSWHSHISSIHNGPMSVQSSSTTYPKNGNTTATVISLRVAVVVEVTNTLSWLLWSLPNPYLSLFFSFSLAVTDFSHSSLLHRFLAQRGGLSPLFGG